MTKKLIGLFASVALMGSGIAFAQDQAQQDTQSQSQGSMGGSGSAGMGQSGSTQGSDIGTGSQSGRQGSSGAMGGSGQQGGQMGQSGQYGQTGQMGQTGAAEQLGGNQITGRVVKSERKMIWVDHAGVIVPLKIDKNTQFTDPNLKRVTDIKEGDQIRASFEVRKTDNVATSIGMSSGLSEGQGGSGSDVLKPDTGINQPSESLPPSSGRGGSGKTGSDINEGSSPNSGASSGGMSSDQNKSTGDY